METDDKKIIEKLLAAGGCLWQRNGKRRVYFNAKVLALVIGFEYSLYNTGNISSAYLHGKKISNTKGRKLYNTISENFYYDLNAKRFFGEPHLYSMVIAGMEKLLEA